MKLVLDPSAASDGSKDFDWRHAGGDFEGFATKWNLDHT